MAILATRGCPYQCTFCSSPSMWTTRYVMRDPKDLVDIASEDIDRKTLETLGAQEIRRLNLIESALARIPNGHYGVCMKCSSRIPRERLEAIPYALLCISCQTSEERRNR